jgi:hypothetical protein
MYGKIYESMFTGSLIGSGACVFAVMSYVIANHKSDRELGAYVEINPVLLGHIFGEKTEVVEAAIKKLCAPDPDTTTPGNEGRRLVRVSQYGYQVVNGAKYRAIRDEEERRTQNREAQRRYRAKKKGLPLPGEAAALRREAAGDVNGAERIAEEALPVEKPIVPAVVQGMPAVVGLDVEEPEPPGIPIPEIRPGGAVAAVKVERPYSA